MTHFQGSLLESGLAQASLGPIDTQIRRTTLSHGAWVDVLPGWVHESDAIFLDLVESVPWKAERRAMYDRVVDVPRLLSWYGEGATLPDPVLGLAREALTTHYASELGEAFRTAGLCYYRDGRDSVAWHGDTIGRSPVGPRISVQFRPRGVR